MFTAVGYSVALVGVVSVVFEWLVVAGYLLGAFGAKLQGIICMNQRPEVFFLPPLISAHFMCIQIMI